ncbi:MAG: hypothetical protein H6712_12520 [Myxococcales bacterium]|nr:hypothetical protein [Myxococcales bacterium]MCB9714681.1 hypothetical protein [Myxococcales bacterium]
MSPPTADCTSLESNILDLHEAIYASKMLLTYCSQERIPVSREALRVLVGAQHRGASESAESQRDFEVEFWSAFNEVMTSVAPVTIESLAASLGTYDFALEGATGTRPVARRTLAQQAVACFRRIALLVLLVLLGVQGYMDWGRMAHDQLRVLGERQAELEDELIRLVASAPAGAPLTVRGTPSYEHLARQRSAVEAQIANNFGALRSWSFWSAWSDPSDGDINPYRSHVLEREELTLTDEATVSALARERKLAETDTEKYELMVTAGMILSLLQAYVLPLLYGLLGASLYVLRTLQHQVRRRTYSPASNADFRIHMSLGALAGIAIGWLLSPGDEASASLSSFALAFLAGYSIDVLFGLMDGLIARIQLSTPGAGEREPHAEPEPCASLGEVEQRTLPA